MKRYLLFVKHVGSNAVGWGNFKGSFDNAGDAEFLAEDYLYIWWQIVDTQTGRIYLERET